MVAFAGNSILGRLALAENAIDPAGFTLIRLLSGAVALLIIVRLKSVEWGKVSLRPNKTDLISAAMLFGYAISFSFSYVNIPTGTGALILFAVVQFSMIGFYLLSGNKMFFWEWVGLALSVSGFVFLMGPSAVRPDLLAAALMAIAGLCWAIFTILGKQSQRRSALAGMCMAFVLASVTGVMFAPLMLENIQLSSKGVLLAVASGAVTSAMGYAIWYTVLPGLTMLTASVVQLSVPALAGLGGWLFMRESISLSEAVATLLILAGIALVFSARKQS